MAEAFDTLTAAEKLQNGGLSDDQSKAIAHVIGDAITGNVASLKVVVNANQCEGDDPGDRPTPAGIEFASPGEVTWCAW